MPEPRRVADRGRDTGCERNVLLIISFVYSFKGPADGREKIRLDMRRGSNVSSLPLC